MSKPKREYVLAFKAVDNNYESIFARAKVVKRKYKIGSVHKTQTELPMYIVPIKQYISWSDIQVGHFWDKMLLVKLPKDKLVKTTPYSSLVNVMHPMFDNVTIGRILSNCDTNKHCGTTELKVLEEVKLDPSYEGDPQQAMSEFEKKYKLKSYERP